MPETQNKINKLPKWAQEHIKALSRERETAVRALNNYCDDQTESKFYIEELYCTGEELGPIIKRRYIQTHKITVEHAGIELNILIREDDPEIDINWSTINDHGDVAFIPSSYMKARLVVKENMR